MSENNVPKVTPKDTKAVILAAHKSALAKLANLEKNPRLAAEQAKNSVIVAKQSGVSIESIVKDLASTRLVVTDGLADLERNLVEKRNQLDEIQVSIKAEEENLKDVMGINREADSFVALVQAHKDTQAAFRQESVDARAEWAKEQGQHLTSVREREAELQKQQKRQREEYAYTFTKEKETSQDEFDQEKKLRVRSLEEHESTVTRGLQEREATIQTQESEFASLKQSVEAFDGQLSEAVVRAAEEAKTRASKGHGFAERALKKDAESTKALLDQKVETLESQVVALTSERDDFKNRLEKSSAELKEVATEAIRGAQTKNYYPTPDTKK